VNAIFTVPELQKAQLNRPLKPPYQAHCSGINANRLPLIHNDKDTPVGSGEAGPQRKKLRQALNDIQWGKAPDTHGLVYESPFWASSD